MSAVTIDLDALAEKLAEKLAEQQTRPALVRASEAAAHLGVPASWLMAEARAGRAPHRRLGKYRLFALDELTAWADRHAHGPRGGAR
jgi:hypothetical protein